jgi:hypothetical protein
MEKFRRILENLFFSRKELLGVVRDKQGDRSK